MTTNQSVHASPLEPILASVRHYQPTIVFAFFHSPISLLVLHRLRTRLPRLRRFRSRSCPSFRLLSALSLVFSWGHLGLFYLSSFNTIRTTRIESSRHNRPPASVQAL